MDLKVAFVIVCLSALAISSTDAGIPKCCIGVIEKLNPRRLLKAERWYLQEDTGACDISALLVYVAGKTTPICISLEWKPFLEKIMRRRQQMGTKDRN
ncbi:C-C motif chemokine 27a [Nothobranchius furzeri]|uniref:C-C motif chemokine 27a n=1 Tax=Nothobranchius furzeri TaxID=105023 RepID=UPI003904B8E8